VKTEAALEEWEKSNKDRLDRPGYGYGNTGKPVAIGSYRGLPLKGYLRNRMTADGHIYTDMEMIIDGQGDKIVFSGLGSLEATARGFEKKRLPEYDQQIASAKADIEKLRAQVGKSFAKAEQLAEKKRRQAELTAAIQGPSQKDLVNAAAGHPEAAGEGENLPPETWVEPNPVHENTPISENENLSSFGARRVNIPGVGWTTEFPSQESLDTFKEHWARKTGTPRFRPTTPPPRISPERKEAIHQALRQLHGSNEDRAREINNIGFNKMDSDFGGQLAEQSELTDRQAAAAAKMLGKYKRQLGEDLHKQVVTDEGLPAEESPAPEKLEKPSGAFHPNEKVGGKYFVAIKQEGKPAQVRVYDNSNDAWMAEEDAKAAGSSFAKMAPIPAGWDFSELKKRAEQTGEKLGWGDVTYHRGDPEEVTAQAANKPVQHSRRSLAITFARLADRALADGDRWSHLIYQRQAREYTEVEG
jgi:hypothetical protein